MRVLCLSLLALTPLTGLAQPFGPALRELRVNSQTSFTQTHPAALVQGDGSFVVVFESDSVESARDVRGRRFSADATPLGPEFRVNTYTTGTQESAVIARGPGGGFVVVWESEEDPNLGIFARRFDAAGVPIGGDFHVNVTSTYQQRSPAVASDSAGNFIVAWQSNSSLNGYDVFARRYSSAGVALTGEVPLTQAKSGDQIEPAISMKPSGEFVVVWSEYGPTSGLFGRRFQSDATPLTDDFPIDTEPDQRQKEPSVTLDDAGFFVVWARDPDVGDPNIFGVRFNASGTPGSTFRVNTATSAFQGTPFVARAGDGTALVVWKDGQTGTLDVRARRFAADGAPLGPEFRVNSYSTGFQGTYTLAAGALRFLVAWGGDPDPFAGVDARLFCVSLAGDADGNGVITVGDILYLINFLFAGGPAPVRGSNVDGSGGVSVSDVLYLINFLFAGGPAPICA